MDARNLKTEQEPRYVSYRDLGEFNTISDIRKLRGIICKTSKSDPCFTCTVMGRKMFILTHSYRTIATATTHDKIRFAIETEEAFESWPQYVQTFFLLHEIGHIVEGHISYLSDHPIISDIEQFISAFFIHGWNRIEIEADLYAKKFMKLSNEKYINCIEIVRRQLNQRYKDDKLFGKLPNKFCDGRIKYVLQRA